MHDDECLQSAWSGRFSSFVGRCRHSAGKVFFVALATDDIVHFTTRGLTSARKKMKDVDRAMAMHGVEKHPGKDITGADAGTAIGIDLSAGRYFSPAGASLLRVLKALLWMCTQAETLHMTPLQLAALLGTMQWHALLNRPSLSCFHSVYAFARAQPASSMRTVPREVLKELLIFAFLSPLLEADVTRPWSDTIIATDASPSFGFGVAVCHAGKDLSRKCGHSAASTYNCMGMDDAPKAVVHRKLLHNVGLRKTKFHTVRLIS